MSNRGFIKHVTKRLRRELKGDINVNVRKSDVWDEKGYKGKHLVNAFTLIIWPRGEDRYEGVYVQSSDAYWMTEEALLVVRKNCSEWLKINNKFNNIDHK